MKTVTKEIEAMPQVCPCLGEAYLLTAWAIAGGERKDGQQLDTGRLLSLLFDPDESFSMRVVGMDDATDRRKTILKWGGDLCTTEVFPIGDWGTSIGVNVWDRERLIATDSWTIDELYDLDLIDLDEVDEGIE